MTLYDIENSNRANKNLVAVVVPGSNEGCYIDIMLGDQVITSHRLACYNCDDPLIKKALKEYNRLLSQGYLLDSKKINL